MLNPFSAKIWNRQVVERFFESRFNYYFSYCINTALMVWMLAPAASAIARGDQVARLLTIIAIAYLLWTLFEWAVHKLVYHDWHSGFTIGHTIHHDRPRALIGVPWFLNTPVYGLMYLGIYHLFPYAEVSAFMGAFGSGYIIYCVIHHVLHRSRMNNPVFRLMLAHHLIHHQHPEFNIGISTSLWDWVFGTKRSGQTQVTA